MRKIKALSVIFLGAVLLLTFAVSFFKQYMPVSGAELEVSGAPALKVDKQFVDLGDVKFEEVVDVTFEITNVGDRPLKFAKQPYVEVLEGC